MKQSSSDGQIPAVKRIDYEQQQQQNVQHQRDKYSRVRADPGTSRAASHPKQREPVQIRRKCTLTVQIGDEEIYEDIVDLDGDDADTEGGDYASKMRRRATANRNRPHNSFENGMVLSPSVPSFCKMDNSPESSTPSPMEGSVTSESSRRANQHDDEGHRIVKTHSLPYISVLGVHHARNTTDGSSPLCISSSSSSSDQSTSNSGKCSKTPSVVGRQKDEFLPPQPVRPVASSSFSGTDSVDSQQYVHEMASKVAKASRRSVSFQPSFMASLQKPTTTAAAHPGGPSITPPPCLEAGTARAHRHFFLSSSLSKLPNAEEEYSSSSSESESDEKNEIVSISKASVRASSNELSTSAIDASPSQQEEPPPTGKKRMRLFNIFSPMFVRFRRKKNKSSLRQSVKPVTPASSSSSSSSSSLENTGERAETAESGGNYALSGMSKEAFEELRAKQGNKPVTKSDPVSNRVSPSSSSSSGSLENLDSHTESSPAAINYPESKQGSVVPIPGIKVTSVTYSVSSSSSSSGSVESSVNRNDTGHVVPGIKTATYAYSVGANVSVEESEDEYWKGCGNSHTADDISSESFAQDDAEPDHSCADEDIDDFEDNDEDDDDDDYDSFDPYVFMGRLRNFVETMPKFMHPAYFVYPTAVPLLSPKDPNKPTHTLVLDLDETLVHCSVEPVASPDFKFRVCYDGNDFLVHAYRRPHLRSFLKRVSKIFELVLFTASLPQYAETLVKILDPKEEIFSFTLFRNACVQGFGSYIKDLSLLGRDLAKTVIVDNSPQAFSFQPDNGIPIRSYFDSKDDAELPKLYRFLQRLSQADDVRPLLRQRYKVSEKIEQATSLSKQP